MAQIDVATQRAAKRFMRQEYDKQVVQQGGRGSAGLEDAGPPTWSRAAWDAFYAQYGQYPFSAGHLPKTFDGAPDWVYELMNLRKPPVSVTLGSAGASYGPTDDLAVWRLR